MKVDFFLEQKRGHAGRFFWSRKQGVLGVFSLEQKISSGNFFVAAEQPDLYADWVRSSSICLDLRLDLPIYFIHYIWMISLFWDHLV